MKPPKNIENIIECVEDVIYNRGVSYYEDGKIIDITFENNTYIAEIEGSYDNEYTCEISVNKHNEIVDVYCNCPYDYDEYCKHVAAVLIAINEADYFTQYGDITSELKDTTITSNKQDTLKLLKDIDKEKVFEFVSEYAQKDTKFKCELLMTIGKPQIELELKNVKKSISDIIKAGKRNGAIDYNDCIDVCNLIYFELESADTRFTEDYPYLTFRIAIYALNKTVKMLQYADDSSGCAGDVIYYCFELLKQSTALLKDENEKKSAFNKLIKEAESDIYYGWSDWVYMFLNTAVILVTQKNQHKLFDVLENIKNRADKDRDEEYFTRIHEEHGKVIELEIIKKLGNAVEVTEFINENLHLDNFRETAVGGAISNKNYNEAIRLCNDKLYNSKDNRIYNEFIWLEKLYNIYGIINDIDKQTETAKRLFFGCKDITYYQKLKSLYKKQNLWDQKYSVVIEEMENKIPYHYYMEILDEENEYDLLLAQIIKHPQEIFHYGKKLIKTNTKQALNIYKTELEKIAVQANNRKQYRQLCRKIESLYRVGGSILAIELIREFNEQYKRRPAMVDELSKLENKLIRR